MITTRLALVASVPVRRVFFSIMAACVNKSERSTRATPTYLRAARIRKGKALHKGTLALQATNRLARLRGYSKSKRDTQNCLKIACVAGIKRGGAGKARIEVRGLGESVFFSLSLTLQ